MKEIRLESLSIRNFKGIGNIEITQFPDVLNIYGTNASGKTSLWDAANYAKFGKDSQNRQDFGIKPLNLYGQAKHKIETEVQEVLNVDGKRITLKRIYKEVWRKKRGAEEAQFDGHTTDYEIDGVPKNRKDYEDVINDICPENLFRLITSPSYFPTVLKWQDQREILFKIAGGLTDEEVAETDNRFQELLDRASGKTFGDYKTMIASKKKKIKERLDYIPARIDEVDRSTPEEKDWDQVQSILSEAEKHYDKLTQEIEDKSKLSAAEYQRRETLQKEGYSLKQRANQLKHDILTAGTETMDQYNTKKKVLEAELSQATRIKERVEQDIEELKELADKKQSRQNELRQEWMDEDAKQFEFVDDRSDILCPNCGEEFKLGDDARPDAEQKFNLNKASKLKDLSEKGKNLGVAINVLKKEIEAKTEELQKAEQTIADINTKVSALKQPEVTSPDPQDNPEYVELLNKIEKINQELSKEIELPDTKELNEKRAEISGQIEEAKDALREKHMIEMAAQRKAELEEEQRNFAQELASLEREEFIMQEFTKAKVEAIEDKVNSMFSITRFKLFDVQVNGQEVETCVATLNGVPYPDVNSAGKVQIGIDIINTLSNHYGVLAPIWIDNRETVVELPPVKAQIINLYVSEKDKTLRIEN